MRDLLILGTSGHAREIAWLVEEINADAPQYRIAGFVASSAEEKGQAVGAYQVRACDAELPDLPRSTVLAMGIATPAIVRKVLARLDSTSGFEFPNLIHPDVCWQRTSLRLGHGNLVCAGALLTTDITLGNFNLLNRRVQIGHDCRLGDRNVLNPGAILSGGVHLGDDCLIGSGAVILQNIVIGSGAVIGAGAVVTRSVPPGVTAVGVPARKMENS